MLIAMKPMAAMMAIDALAWSSMNIQRNLFIIILCLFPKKPYAVKSMR